MVAGAGHTRLCVKGLPKHLTNERLRKHFEDVAEVTDARVCTRSDGASRNFGFVGFRTEKDAQKCLKYFHDTFIDTSKIICEIARPKGDENLARPWSRYSEGSSAHQRITKKDENKAEVASRPGKGAAKPGTAASAKEKKIASKDHELLERAKTDPKMKAFIDAFKPRTKTKVWENDDAVLNDANAVALKEMTQVPVRSRKAGGEGIVHTRTHVKFDDDGESSDEEYQDLTAGKKDKAEGADEAMDVDGGVQGAGKAFDHELDDMAYLKTKTSEWKDSEDEEEEEGEEEESEDEETGGKEGKKEGKKAAAQNKRGAVGKVNFDDLSDPSENEDGDAEMGEGEAGDEEPTRDAATHDDGREGEGEDEDEDGRLFIRNLPYGTNEEELTAFFKRFGELSEVHMCIDKATKRPTGFAFVLYLHPADAESARQATDERYYQGRVIRVEPAKMKKKAADDEAADESGGYKAQKAKQLQKTAASSHNWNMLFMRSDTVAEAVAKGHSLTKGELLDHESAQSLAVRMALGETHVVDQTKKMLRESGVNVAALEVEKKPEKRSKTALLVKNIPHSTEDGELRDLFARFGDLSRLVLPPTKTMALVEFDEATEARKAFRQLAYSKFKNQPIYLEWAPVDIFDGPPPDAAEKEARKAKAGGGKNAAADASSSDSKHQAAPDSVPAHQHPKVDVEKGAKGRKADKAASAPAENAGKGAGAEGEAAAGEAGATVYVKNLSFETKEEALRRAMAQGGKVKAVKLMTKPNPRDKSARLSMGYGFVEYASAKEAQSALKKLQGVDVDGHKLQLKMSSRTSADASGDGHVASAAAAKGAKKGAGAAGAGGADESNTRLVVRNVPFEATRKELRELLSAFGELTSIRLPKKFDGKHRGFAFADFVTHQEAVAAKDALQATHLYGRHLVIEWAEEEQSLEAVRRKTARYFSKLSETGPGDGTAKRRKIEETLEGADDGEDNAFEDAFR